MTFLEASLKEHPCTDIDKLIGLMCPPTIECPRGMSCDECWNQEIPETKTEKENTNMENNVATTNTATTRKTKTQLLEEINALKAEIVKLDKYKQYEDMANEMYAIQQSFVNAGFTSDQAFKLMIEMIHTAGRTIGK